MSSEQFKHIQRIRDEFHRASKIETVRDSLNNAIQHLAEGLYSERLHFIFELIQNAEDNEYEDQSRYQPYISFQLTKTDPTFTMGSNGALIIQNNEFGFHHNNVIAICAVGKTTKKKGQGYIGEKGIGFKSVFRITDNPHIFSNGYHFCLPERDEQTGFGYIVPQWIDTPPAGMDLSATHIILPLTKPDFGYEEIEEMLRDIEPEIILFLFKLQEIQIKTDTGDDYTILKDNSAMPEVQIVAEGSKQGVFFYNSDDFLICTEPFRKPTNIHHEEREGVRSRHVTIGFPLDKNSTGSGKIFAYLPVRSGSGFPFLINADFILTSSRENIQDVPWNRSWLVYCVADLVAKKLLPLLKQRKLLSVDFLEALASKLNELDEDKKNLFYPVFTKLRETFLDQELLPTNDDSFVSAKNAVLTRSDAVRNLLTYAQLGSLFPRSDVDSGSTLKWLSAEITQDRAPNLRRYLMVYFEIEEVTPTMFARKLFVGFLSSQKDEWFIKFYEFLSGQRALWDSDGDILRAKPIIRLEDGTHVNPPKKGLVANAYLLLEAETDSSLPIVKSEISQNGNAFKFLKDLGVPEWDIVAEVIKHILPKYQNNPSVTSGAEYNRDFSKIVDAYSTDSNKEKDQLWEVLMKTPFILEETSNVSDQNYLRPDQICFGTDGRLWLNHSIGNYSLLSVDEQTHRFLRTLDIPRWSVVDEVMKIILPKYKQTSLTVLIKEHMSDLAKIAQAYENGVQFKKIQLQTELQTTRFILPQGTHECNPEYCRPDELYFRDDELLLYFQGNNSYKFVSSKYPDKYIDIFRKWGISDRIQIICESRPGATDDVNLPYQYYYRRGLKGFDPNIQVAGLEHALMNPSVAKSKIIWDNVVRPYSHCIRGVILESSRQDFSRHARIYKEDEEISNFGHMLMENAWLPDSDGNMHKPSEITLAELPEEFVRDERLADQLRMKKNEVAELANKLGVSEGDIVDFVENKEKYMEWKAEKEKQEQSLSPKSKDLEPKTIPHPINYPIEFKKSFNKSGKTEVKTQIIDDGKVRNPERRREKIAEDHSDRLNDEPNGDGKRRETYRTILEGPDPQVREYLSQMYGGKCQICNSTFPERDGKPFFVASYIVERQKSGAVDTQANALCLCADHFAKFKHGVVEAEDISIQIENFQTESEGGDYKPVLDIKLCGEECGIHFKEKHLLDLQELIKASNKD